MYQYRLIHSNSLMVVQIVLVSKNYVDGLSASSQDSDGCTPLPPSFSKMSHCSGIILINDAENIVINMLYVGMSLCSIESGSFSNWSGFKIVGDNLDITICPRSQRVDCKASSLHFFNCETELIFL